MQFWQNHVEPKSKEQTAYNSYPNLSEENRHCHLPKLPAREVGEYLHHNTTLQLWKESFEMASNQLVKKKKFPKSFNSTQIWLIFQHQNECKNNIHVQIAFSAPKSLNWTSIGIHIFLILFYSNDPKIRFAFFIIDTYRLSNRELFRKQELTDGHVECMPWKPAQ